MSRRGDGADGRDAQDPPDRPDDRDPLAPAPEVAAPEAVAPEATEMRRLRQQILECDQELVDVVARRRDLVHRIAALKERLGLPVTDPAREATVARRAAGIARAKGLDEELVRDLVWKMMASARDEQQRRTSRQSRSDGERED